LSARWRRRRASTDCVQAYRTNSLNYSSAFRHAKQNVQY
jgi:hypothetical protein